ncbi:MAG: hypothetical protein LBE91_05540 [Tannerella sp.]|jgi:hypothetical protein|nr:hypothetical protein [Tannerella sp.]
MICKIENNRIANPDNGILWITNPQGREMRNLVFPARAGLQPVRQINNTYRIQFGASGIFPLHGFEDFII